MHVHHPNVAVPIVACLVGVLAFACRPALCNADEPAREEKPKPKVVLDAGTQEDADAALAVIEKFLGLWQERKYDEASKLVTERVREEWVKTMKRSAIKLQRIEDIRLFKPRDELVARVHVFVDPNPDRKDLKKQEKGLDMVFRDGKWWVTAR
jgi:hypothetical protein